MREASEGTSKCLAVAAPLIMTAGIHADVQELKGQDAVDLARRAKVTFSGAALAEMDHQRKRQSKQSPKRGASPDLRFVGGRQKWLQAGQKRR